MVLLPGVASPLVPAYHLEELLGQPPLVLSFEVISDIFLANISHWNDSKIATLNPNVTLPPYEITVVVQNISSVITYLVSAAIAPVVSEFNLSVPYR